jgi:CRISPR/Cas system-associated protein Csx1
MDKSYLIETAQNLSQISLKASDEYSKKAEQLIAKINTIMSERPDIESLVGVDNINMMKDNHANHVRFIASILKNYNSDVLVDTVLWVFRAYRSHGFTTNYWAAQLNTWIMIIKEELTPDCFAEVYPYYEWMQINIPVFVKVSDEKMKH